MLTSSESQSCTNIKRSNMFSWPSNTYCALYTLCNSGQVWIKSDEWKFTIWCFTSKIYLHKITFCPQLIHLHSMNMKKDWKSLLWNSTDRGKSMTSKSSFFQVGENDEDIYPKRKERKIEKFSLVPISGRIKF